MAVGGPLGRLVRAVLNKKKSSSQMAPASVAPRARTARTACEAPFMGKLELGLHLATGGGGCSRKGRPGFRFRGGGGQSAPKNDPWTSMVPMAVVLVFKDTRPLVNSGYMYVAPQHGLPLEPHELVRLRVASRVTVRVSDIVAVGIRVRVRARARVRVGAGVTGGGRGGARRAPARGCSRPWCIVRISQAAT